MSIRFEFLCCIREGARSRSLAAAMRTDGQIVKSRKFKCLWISYFRYARAAS